MPLFTLRRRRRTSEPEQPGSTASLPDFRRSVSGLGSWPESLVDASSLSAPHDDADASTISTRAGPTKSGLQGPISFHRPFRNGPPPSAFHTTIITNGKHSTPDKARTSTFVPPSPASSTPRKRPYVPPQTFNLIVAGRKLSGKTSLLNLLLSTSPTAPTSSDTPPRLSTDPTKEIQSATIQVEHALRRYVLTVIDTPGLDFTKGRELEFDRAVQRLVRYQENLMSETLRAESQVVREFRPDQQVHICLYLIDPTTILYPNPPTTDYCIHPSDLTAIRRLSLRYSVLPIISKGDTLTNSQLNIVKHIVAQAIQESGVGWGVFRGEKPRTNGNGNGNGLLGVETGKGKARAHSSEDRTRPELDPADPPVSVVEPDPQADSDSDADAAPATPPPRVIHIRPTTAPLLTVPSTPNRIRRSRSLSRARPSADSSESDEPGVRGSERDGAKEETGALLPFAVIAPEEVEGVVVSGEDGGERKWVRRYRWGDVDVMSKEHCDFWALRKAVLGLHFKTLKNDTRRVLYEKFRTERLLVRRATKDLSEAERERLLAV